MAATHVQVRQAGKVSASVRKNLGWLEVKATFPHMLPPKDRLFQACQESLFLVRLETSQPDPESTTDSVDTDSTQLFPSLGRNIVSQGSDIFSSLFKE